jgi:hypothetical protein
MRFNLLSKLTMEQLLNLLNEYEESMIDKSLEEEDPE